MRVFKLKYKDGRLSKSYYFSFYFQGKKIQKKGTTNLEMTGHRIRGGRS